MFEKKLFRPDYIKKALNDSCLESKIVNISEEELRSISERAPSIQRFNDVTEENYNKKQAWLKLMKIVVENAGLT